MPERQTIELDREYGESGFVPHPLSLLCNLKQCSIERNVYSGFEISQRDINDGIGANWEREGLLESVTRKIFS